MKQEQLISVLFVHLTNFFYNQVLFIQELLVSDLHDGDVPFGEALSTGTGIQNM